MPSAPTLLEGGSICSACAREEGLREKGVRHQKPERPFGCFALLVSDPFFPTADTHGTNLGYLSEPRALAVGVRRILTTFSSPTASARGSKPVLFVSDPFFPTPYIKSTST